MSCHESAGSAGPVGMIAATWSAASGGCPSAGPAHCWRPRTNPPERPSAPPAPPGRAFRDGCRATSPNVGRDSKIFIAHVETAEQGHLAVTDDDLAVVAEVELQPRPPIAVDAERMALDSGVLEFLQVVPRQLVRADFVEQEIHFHPGAGPADERLLETDAQLVVLDDEEIHAQIALRLVRWPGKSGRRFPRRR